MKVATYNFCQGGADFNSPYRVLAALQPDILFAQELLDPQLYLERSPTTWRDLGYQDPVWQLVPDRKVKRWGSAIFTKQDIIRSITTLDASYTHLAGWITGVEIDLSHFFGPHTQPWKLFSIHTPTKAGNNDYIRQAQDVIKCLATHEPGANLLVGGDFNVTISVRAEQELPVMKFGEQEIIIYMQRTLGLVNCWQSANPNTPLPRTFHGREHSNKHIDGIFVSASGYPFLKSSAIIGLEQQWPEGDHYPVVAKFTQDKPTFKERPPSVSTSGNP